MVAGKNSRQMGRNSRGRVATILLSLLFMIGAVIPMAHPYGNNVYAAAQVTTWDGLRLAVRYAVEHGDDDNNVIEIADDFFYDGESIEIPEGADIILKGSGTIYSSQRATYDSMFKVKSGGKLTIESGVTLSGKMMGDQGQTCPDGKDGRPTYTKDNFTGDLNNADNPTDYVPKGFFIQVESGGKATLKGTVSDFITSRDKDKTPRYVAPIVANGKNAVFNLDGGTIKNNLVGYIVDDSQANKDAQSIKQYVKGAGPNVPRVPQASVQKENKDSFDRPRNKDAGIDGGLPGTGITATAGAVIYKGEAQGTILDGTITNNRGDTGGIMVSGEGTTVNMESGVISKNVGVQFGGGSTVEQGGTIEMTRGNMEYNVAWFGGGAVYATENGVAWLLGLMNGEDGLHPQFDDRLDGRFLMSGGSLNNNTALTRGGAILADSDAVDVKRGELKKNMSRMLGGAVYVMGDHPKYTYTMYLTGLHVHDNVAVSGIKEARDSAANGPSSMYNETQLDNFNSSLQRTLTAPSACGDVPDDVLGDVFTTPNSDDMNDGWGTHGTGGGVWLCAYGTTYFNAGATSQVVIAKNYATGAVPLNQYGYPGWIKNSSDGKTIREDIAYNTAASVATGTGRTGGNDLHADTGSSGSVIIKNESGYPGWIDENASTSSEVKYDLPVSEDRVNIVNNGDAHMAPENVQVEVSENISRRGGGLAANGTFMLGMRDDQANVESAVDLKKAWHATAEKKPVSIRVSAVQGSNTAVIADVPLDGEANAPISEYDAVEELAPTGSAWNGRFKLPIELNGTEGKIKVFTLVLKEDYRKDGDTDGIIDPTTLSGRAKLAEAIKSIKEKHKDSGSGEIDEEAAIAEINDAISIKFSEGLKLSCKEYEMVYDDESESWTIKTESGQPVESSSYIFTSKDVDLSEASFDLQSTSFYGEEYNQQTGQMEPVEIYQVHVFGIELALDAQNDNNPITEKYVNKEVHSDIVNFDQDFEYDIMAYVPLTAEEFTISDTLVNGLEFAGPGGNKNNDPEQVVRSIAVKTLNNHKPGEEGSVSGPGEPGRNGNPINLKPGQHPVLPGGKTINVNTRLGISGKTLTVTVPAGDTLDFLKGKWVQVTFGARIEDKYRNIDALKALSAGVVGKDKSWEGTGTDKKGTDKKGDPAYEYLVANGDKAIVAPILAEVGPDPVIWAVEAPSRLFARTAKGDYYATPFNDKNGNTWTRLNKELDDDEDENRDKGYGKSVWINADNRYYGRAPHTSNTRRQLGLEDSELNSLKGMPLIVGSEVTKAAEGATRYFAEVTDAGGGVHIWATDKGELDSLTWHEVTETSSDEYIQAQGRLANDRYTIRMLDLKSDTITLDPNSETGKNWPVISKEDHEGMANQGVYSVKFGNNAEAKTYKTNTVTVKPETTKIQVEKLWGADGKGSWPDDVKSVTFDIYAIPGNDEIKPVYVDDDNRVVGVAGTKPDGSKQWTITLTRDDPATTDKDESKATVTGLPRLKGYIYLARETKITDTDGRSYDLVYSDPKINEGVVSDVTTIGDTEISSSMKFSYVGEGAKFESLRDSKTKKVVRGAIADDRLWAMTLDGSYFVTAEGDTEGNKDSTWTAIDKPTSQNTDDYVIYDRARELLGTIDSASNAAEAFDIENAVTAINRGMKYVDVEATKKWKGTIKDEIPSADDFKSFLVLKNSKGEDVSETHKDKLEITARGITYIAKWSRIPEDEYTVEEKPVPGFASEIGIDGVITNTKKPSDEKPEIEKYVNQAVHKDIELDEVFTYDIIAYVTKDADSVTITDKLHDMLTFAGGASDVKVVDLGESINHKVTNSIENVKVNDNATVAKEGKTVEGAEVTIDGQTLKVFITNKLKESSDAYSPVEIVDTNPKDKGYYEQEDGSYVPTEDTEAQDGKAYYVRNEKYDEVSNPARPVENGYYELDGEKYILSTDTEAEPGKKYYTDASTYENVTIKPVNPSEEGYYELVDGAYVATEDESAQADKNYYAKDKEVKGYEYDGDVQPVKALRGHWIKVTFKARINDKTLEEVRKAYQKISADKVDESRDPDNRGNAPVISAEDHTGLPNDASYTIGVANEAGIQEDVHKDKSNVVTVKPKEKDKPDSGKNTDGGKPDDGEKDVQPDADQETKKPEQSKSGTTSANTGDEAPIGAALAGLLGAAGALVIMRRRRAKRID